MWFRQKLLKLQICLALASPSFFPKGRSLHGRAKNTKQPWEYIKKQFLLRATLELNIFILKPG